ncbi:hypothetical protein Hjap01_03390 [Haloarcula japonica]
MLLQSPRKRLSRGKPEMPTTAGIAYVVAMTLLFALWIYGAVSLYFDVRYRFLPKLLSWLRERRSERRQLA